jgi:hypothetical protein
VRETRRGVEGGAIKRGGRRQRGRCPYCSRGSEGVREQPATAHARRGVRVCFSLKGGNANKKTWAARLSTRAARLSTTLSSRARPAPGRPNARVEDGAAQGGGGALGGLEEVDDAGDRERRVRAGGQHAQARQQVRHVGRAGASGGDKDAGVAEERGRNGEVWAWGWRAHPRPLSLSLSPFYRQHASGIVVPLSIPSSPAVSAEHSLASP